ncbi:PREDICTED: DDRGK domain-containing protein 1 [Acromyrmex echinatior]|uniref:DDRGK domain-containing protein 1 n=1 Tax=Acromyrmex echinatior TaxID=103372 RepID=F4WRB5_ACREC|nr:PREDICTED: DDRGK domain-containing protein 1 [Acromyrmex echinatior]EGI63332.1 DDRGK domain-containing protein 1 [Acromyrmex echinatior]
MDVDLLIYFSVAIIILTIICTALLQVLAKRNERANIQNAEVEPQGQPRQLRRVGAVRNARRRMQENANHANYRPEENDRQIYQNNDEDEDHKIGTKKRAKLAAKAEKKIQREAAEREREEHKKREQFLQEERDKQAEKEHVEQLRAEEVEKKAREEKERQEYEEYLKMKEAFSVEEEGYEQENRECEENLLQEFLAYIKLNKVLVLEDLAAHFGLKTANVVERIQELQANGNLTGVIDDRGKFIYISEDELEAVAKFMRQRGRVSITELAENSNNLC